MLLFKGTEEVLEYLTGQSVPDHRGLVVNGPMKTRFALLKYIFVICCRHYKSRRYWIWWRYQVICNGNFISQIEYTLVQHVIRLECPLFFRTVIGNIDGTEGYYEIHNDSATVNLFSTGGHITGYLSVNISVEYVYGSYSFIRFHLFDKFQHESIFRNVFLKMVPGSHKSDR